MVSKKWIQRPFGHFDGRAMRHFQMAWWRPALTLDLALAPGFEPGNGGIKISLIFQRFQCAFGKIRPKRGLLISAGWEVFPNESSTPLSSGSSPSLCCDVHATIIATRQAIADSRDCIAKADE
jgi:hypothetical protein